LRAPLYPWASIAGVAALAAITVSTWWVPGMKITLLAGLPWLALITVCYLVWAWVNNIRNREATRQE
jgi:L-asparagine transporter-like permease